MNIRCEWMSGKFGLMMHYLPPVLETSTGETFQNVDECVEHFDINRFFEYFDASGAEWLIFTLGQNTGMYNSPNSVIESLTGPGHCAQRDLALEIAGELKKRGKFFIAYLPMEAHCNNTIKSRLGWIPEMDEENGKISRQERFQSIWCRVIREWSLRFSSLLDGWFFDGGLCVVQAQEDKAAMFQAARSGNPNAAVSLNQFGFDLWDGQSIYYDEDYFSGEATLLKEGLPLTYWRTVSALRAAQLGLPSNIFPERKPYVPDGKYMPGFPNTLCHVLAPIDAFWWRKNNVNWLDNEPGKPIYAPGKTSRRRNGTANVYGTRVETSA